MSIIRYNRRYNHYGHLSVDLWCAEGGCRGCHPPPLETIFPLHNCLGVSLCTPLLWKKRYSSNFPLDHILGLERLNHNIASEIKQMFNLYSKLYINKSQSILLNRINIWNSKSLTKFKIIFNLCSFLCVCVFEYVSGGAI